MASPASNYNDDHLPLLLIDVLQYNILSFQGPRPKTWTTSSTFWMGWPGGTRTGLLLLWPRRCQLSSTTRGTWCRQHIRLQCVWRDVCPLLPHPRQVHWWVALNTEYTWSTWNDEQACIRLKSNVYSHHSKVESYCVSGRVSGAWGSEEWSGWNIVGAARWTATRARSRISGGCLHRFACTLKGSSVYMLGPWCLGASDTGISSTIMQMQCCNAFSLKKHSHNIVINNTEAKPNNACYIATTVVWRTCININGVLYACTFALLALVIVWFVKWI